MTDRRGEPVVYACCQHCEHRNGTRHPDPCEDERCEGARPLKDDSEKEVTP